jgi:fructose-1,6-bisphosphatase I
MSNYKLQTLGEFIIDREPDLLPLFMQLKNAVRIIYNRLSVAGLENLTGLTGDQNGYGEDVQKLDDFANTLLCDKIMASKTVACFMSEELENPVWSKEKNEKYIFATDPLDGSSNIDISLSIGTIFSIYKNTGELLQKGSQQIASGYFLFSTACLLVLTLGDGVYVFNLDETMDSFLMIESNLTIPENGKIYSINEGNWHKFNTKTQNYIEHVKKESYKLRYVGSMVADVHRTLLKGGVFLYPTDSSNPTGKLRLLYEINPMSFLIQQAGGKSILEDGTDPMTLIPTKHDQTLPIILGSKVQVEEFDKTSWEPIKQIREKELSSEAKIIRNRLIDFYKTSINSEHFHSITAEHVFINSVLTLLFNDTDSFSISKLQKFLLQKEFRDLEIAKTDVAYFVDFWKNLTTSSEPEYSIENIGVYCSAKLQNFEL